MQLLSGVLLDDETEVIDLTDEELGARALKRRELRLMHPGLALVR